MNFTPGEYTQEKGNCTPLGNRLCSLAKCNSASITDGDSWYYADKILYTSSLYLTSQWYSGIVDKLKSENGEIEIIPESGIWPAFCSWDGTCVTEQSVYVDFSLYASMRVPIWQTVQRTRPLQKGMVDLMCSQGFWNRVRGRLKSRIKTWWDPQPRRRAGKWCRQVGGWILLGPVWSCPTLEAALPWATGHTLELFKAAESAQGCVGL